MSHNIEYYSYPENCDRAKVKAEIDHFVAMEDYQEGCTGLYHPIRWIETEIYPDYETAVKVIEKLDRRDYDNLAVRYMDYEVYTDKKVEELQRKVWDAYKELNRRNNIIYASTVKAAYITCKVCGSRLSRTHLMTNKCLLCGADMRPDTLKKSVDTAKKKWETAQKNLVVYQRKKAKKNVRWLVKFEYHT